MSDRAVIFDMDGVLIDSAEAHKESWRVLAKDLRVTITDQQFAAQFGRASRDIIRCFFGAATTPGRRRPFATWFGGACRSCRGRGS